MADVATGTLAASSPGSRHETWPLVPTPGAIVLGSFYVMIASFLFEMPPGVFRYQMPSIAAALFIGCTTLQLRRCYRWMPSALPWFLAFLWLFTAAAVLHGWLVTWDMQRRVLFLVQVLTVFWAAANLMSDDRVATAALWSFVIACVVRAALPYLGVGRTTYDERWTGGERVTAFGQDPNFSATLLSAGLVTLIWLTHGRARRSRWLRLAAWSLAGILALAILDTGSRGGLIALLAGVLASMFRYADRSAVRLRQMVIAIAAVAALGVAAMHTQVMRGRVEATESEGTLAGREKLFPAAWSMFLEKPFTGWGPQLNEHELAKRAPFLGHNFRDSHNLFLEVLTSTGVTGTAPFLVGLALCLAAAWRARRGRFGVLPLALLGVFLTANLDIDMLENKPFWFALAFAVVGGRAVSHDA